MLTPVSKVFCCFDLSVYKFHTRFKASIQLSLLFYQPKYFLLYTNSTLIQEKMCTIVYKVYTNNYFDLTFVDKFQQCLDLSVYKFLLWFDLCIQRDTVIWPQKRAENWWKTVDNFLHWFQISVYNCPSCFSSQNYTP